ncbi:MAG TPA: (2Fe-2S)-binding protein [Gemmatimonadales bacterium]|nr:(2Fe-2S)-binding protein [Gemmatimonadales bacterium]
MRIDRCICTGLTFREVGEQARANGWDLEAVRDRLGAGANCGLCRPYLRRTLSSGETVFHTVITDPPDGT